MGALLLAAFLMSGTLTAMAAEVITPDPGKTEVEYTVSLGSVSGEYAAAQFDVVIGDSDKLDIAKEGGVPDVVSGSGLPPVLVSDGRKDGNQISYKIGYMSADGENELDGDREMCTITFKYTGTEPVAVAFKNFELIYYAGMDGDIPKYNTVQLDREDVITVAPNGASLADAPTASPRPGTYSSAQSVILRSATDGAAIYYTTDGTTPTADSTKYTGAIAVGKTMTIKAVAVKSGMTNSAVVSFAYTISSGTSGGATTTDPEPSAGEYVFPFTDVADGAWYRADVEAAYKLGLIDGKTATAYMPDGNMTIAEAIKLASCMNQLKMNGKITLENGTEHWYDTYVAYAAANGIVTDVYEDYDAPITRAEYAYLFSRALPESEYFAINTIGDDKIPDVKLGDQYAESIYKLYRAGIVAGSDELGTFLPNNTIKRSETAAILVRMMDKTARKSLTLG